ncbi:hypothetical protein PG990_004868 [Apiospora arundinis]
MESLMATAGPGAWSLEEEDEEEEEEEEEEEVWRTILSDTVLNLRWILDFGGPLGGGLWGDWAAKQRSSADGVHVSSSTALAALAAALPACPPASARVPDANRPPIANPALSQPPPTPPSLAIAKKK